MAFSTRSRLRYQPSVNLASDEEDDDDLVSRMQSLSTKEARVIAGVIEYILDNSAPTNLLRLIAYALMGVLQTIQEALKGTSGDTFEKGIYEKVHGAASVLENYPGLLQLGAMFIELHSEKQMLVSDLSKHIKEKVHMYVVSRDRSLVKSLDLLNSIGDILTSERYKNAPEYAAYLRPLGELLVK
jgi:hypothetical protein